MLAYPNCHLAPYVAEGREGVLPVRESTRWSSVFWTLKHPGGQPSVSPGRPAPTPSHWIYLNFRWHDRRARLAEYGACLHWGAPVPSLGARGTLARKGATVRGEETM